MVRVKGLAGPLLAALLAGSAAAQGDLAGFASRIPQCGITCILQEIPKSVCGSLTNSTCICTDEKLRSATQECILRTCVSALDGIETAKVEAEACQRPYRDRRKILWAPLSIESVAFLSVWMRLYGRWTTMHTFEADDWIMMLSMIIYVPFVAIGNYIDPNDIMTALKLFYVAESFYLVMLALTKISLLCFFLRVFPNVKFRWATFATMAYVAISATILVFMQIFQCLPIRFNWERLMGDFGPHRCLNINALAYTAAGVSISQDILILILPLPLLIGLNMSWRSKGGIMIMFSLGAFILITSCIRLQFLVLFARSANPTWDNSDALIWTGLEVSVSVLVTSLPAIRVLLARVLPGVFTSVVSKNSGQSGQSASAKKSLTGTTSQHSRVGDSKAFDRRQQELQQEELQRQRERQQRQFEEERWRQGEERRRQQLEDEEMQRQQHQQWLHQQQDQQQHARNSIPLRSGRRTPQYLPPIPRSKFNIHIFGWGSRSESRTSGNESEEELELGDRIQGEVHTEIGVADGGIGNEVYGYDAFYQESSVESGIHVHTRTTIDSWHRPPREPAERWPNR
ncbi:hypothetical protein F5X68DRAFT_278261 [Plectosphaerella plurivora]|uniref:CFEM domain-containing protein n=1 Tax=Plectosphaerella plurivora TaxID=936078 RepID=A0A9P8V5T2_9PEZI|nr:hypothetical protein F5X68DRAFT_278261 [Plectosphaerella plurivora]